MTACKYWIEAALRKLLSDVHTKWKFHVTVQYDIQSSCAYADVMSFVNFGQAYFMG